MITLIVEAFQFDFFIRAFITGILLAITYALLGNFIVIRNEAIIGHTMANLVFLGIALGTLFSLNLNLIMILTALAGVFFIDYLQRSSRINRDSILALTAEISIAASIVILAFIPGYQNIEGFLFGNILAVSDADLKLTLALFISGIAILSWLYKPLTRLMINPDLAISSGTPVRRINFIFMLLLALSVAMGIKIIGIILLAAFLVIPANIAKNIAGNFKQMAALSVIFALLGVMIGLILSYALDTPSGAMIVLILGILLLLTHLLKNLIWKI